ncbi:MAG: hypothetical protein IPJ13_20210 [Saprospiraceae bacterium]|nr:hypothetical protein [Saprospiraceae bacterium]
MNISPFKVFRWFFSITTAIVWIYTLIYLTSGLEDIKSWYTGNLFDFYKMDTWKDSIFSPDVKKSGNILSLTLSLLLTLTTVYLWRIRDDDTNLRLHLRVNMWHIAIGIFCISAWLWYGHYCPYAYDEVFSAYHFAAGPLGFLYLIIPYPITIYYSICSIPLQAGFLMITYSQAESYH